MTTRKRREPDPIDPEPIDELRPEFANVLEDELVTLPDISDFWERKDAIQRLLSGSDRESPPDLDQRWKEALEVLPPALIEELRPVIFEPETLPGHRSALWVVLRDWEFLRLDPEKMIGHLAREHGHPAQPLVELDLEELTRRHNQSHADERERAEKV
jgi:hypothetical protein